jgi:hypothetical protein
VSGGLHESSFEFWLTRTFVRKRPRQSVWVGQGGGRQRELKGGAVLPVVKGRGVRVTAGPREHALTHLPSGCIHIDMSLLKFLSPVA